MGEGRCIHQPSTEEIGVFISRSGWTCEMGGEIGGRLADRGESDEVGFLRRGCTSKVR